MLEESGNLILLRFVKAAPNELVRRVRHAVALDQNRFLNHERTNKRAQSLHVRGCRDGRWSRPEGQALEKRASSFDVLETKGRQCPGPVKRSRRSALAKAQAEWLADGDNRSGRPGEGERSSMPMDESPGC
jgi:hypothetical protein